MEISIKIAIKSIEEADNLIEKFRKLDVNSGGCCNIKMHIDVLDPTTTYTINDKSFLALAT